MITRLTVESVSPCEIHTEVISDTGPVAPILLSEGLLGPSVSQTICESL